MDIEALFAIFLVILFIFLPLLRQKGKAHEDSATKHLPPAAPKKRTVAQKAQLPRQETALIPQLNKSQVAKEAAAITTKSFSHRKALILGYEILSPPLALRGHKSGEITEEMF